MIAFLWLLGFMALIMALAFRRHSLGAATGILVAYLLAFSLLHAHPLWWDAVLWALFLGTAAVLNLERPRRRLISDPVFTWFRGVMPRISETERNALEAGTVWWDGELFSGRPDWARLLAYPAPRLSEEEQAFLDGPTEALCDLVDPWEVSHDAMDLPAAVWRAMRGEGFFGLGISPEHGGKGFSALAHSAIVMKLGSRSADLGSTVTVPNSLGPAELLAHYGTNAQRTHYLPRLASGEEIPCFALTGPWAGSDAGSIPDTGVVCRGHWNGEEVLGLRLNFEKRYITLAPVATLIGLAFKARDPDRLLGEDEELGITLALIPGDTPGLERGRRHFPLNAAFMNGPIQGRDVFIPLDSIIGGRERIGQGWQMLVECLAAGRAISLPAGAVATAKMAALTSGAYARIREQFDQPIGEFEGVREPLARIAGNAYVMDAARRMTAGALDQGEAPAVLSAVVKYHLTERQRQCLADAMDIHGGKGICLGPANYLGRAWQTAPISITVEGANILTRSLMIFGQGAIRCHPYVLAEMLAAREPSRERGRSRFDRLLLGHTGFALSNAVRSLVLGITGGRLARPRGTARETRALYGQLSRFAASFALLADVSMLVLGGSLKRRERLSARLGDALSHLYLASATLKRYEADGRPREDLPLVQWGVRDSLHRIQCSLDEVLANFPARPLAALLRPLIFPVGRRHRPVDDATSERAARLVMVPGEARERLLSGIYRTTDPDDAVGAVEHALRLILDAEPIERRIHNAHRDGAIHLTADADRIAVAEANDLIDEREAKLLREANAARRRVIMVDDFAHEELARDTAGQADQEERARH